MTWIKICGITNLEDALTAVEAGADAVGLIFHEKSPRKIDPETARRIVAELPAKVEKVGVFVLQGSPSVSEIAEQVGLTSLQVHIQLPLPNQQSQEEWRKEYGIDASKHVRLVKVSHMRYQYKDLDTNTVFLKGPSSST